MAGLLHPFIQVAMAVCTTPVQDEVSQHPSTRRAKRLSPTLRGGSLGSWSGGHGRGIQGELEGESQERSSKYIVSIYEILKE